MDKYVMESYLLGLSDVLRSLWPRVFGASRMLKMLGISWNIGIRKSWSQWLRGACTSHLLLEGAHGRLSRVFLYQRNTTFFLAAESVLRV